MSTPTATVAAGSALVHVALVVIATGDGGVQTPSQEIAVLLVVVAALLASLARAPAPPPPSLTPWMLTLGGVLLLSASQAAYRFGSLVAVVPWAAALALAASLARLRRAAPGWPGFDVLALGSVAGLLALQGLAELGFVLGGRGGERPVGEALGTFFDPNRMATVLVLGVAMLLDVVVRRQGRIRLVALALASLSTVGILASGSRVGPVALLLVLALAMARRQLAGRGISRRTWVAAALVGALLGVAGLAVIAAKSGDAEAWRRPTIWKAVAPALAERPVLGIGPGAWQHQHYRYQEPVWRGMSRLALRPSRPHGEWLRLPLEIGVLGVLALGSLAVAWLVRLRRAGAVVVARGIAPVVAVLPFAAVHDVLEIPAVAAWLAAALAHASVGEGREPTTGPAQAVLGAAHARIALPVGLGAAALVGGLALRPAIGHVAAVGARAEGDLDRLQDAISVVPGQPHHLLALAAWLAPEREDGRERQALPLRRAVAAEIVLAEAGRAAPRLPAPPRRRARLAARMADGPNPVAGADSALAERYAEAIAADPHDVGLATEAASATLGVGRFRESLRHAGHALELEPAAVTPRALRVLALEGLGRPAEAADARRELRIHLETVSSLEATTDYERALLEAPPDLLTVALGGER